MDEKPFDQREYVNAYNREHYEQITLRVPKGTRDRITEAAAKRGMSVNHYIISLIDADREG